MRLADVVTSWVVHQHSGSRAEVPTAEEAQQIRHNNEWISVNLKDPENPDGLEECCLRLLGGNTDCILSVTTREKGPVLLSFVRLLDISEIKAILWEATY